jgi:saxitoxin biosynthesis operon SxtJ-like protein
MILEQIKKLKTGERELRKFGWLVGGVFTALASLMWLRHKAYFPYFLVPGVMLIAFGFLRPKALKYVYVAWMSVAIVIGFVVSNVILTLFFFLVITPIGLITRLLGKDFLALKIDREAPTYWMARERATQTAAEYERQF